LAGPRLTPELRAESATVDVPGLLSSLARDAVDLLSGPLADRIRTCAADECSLLYVDASRAGRRRWCSMNTCGARAKMATYRAVD
jgi:predicted RNA-binding Zn ribbon-like protein